MSIILAVRQFVMAVMPGISTGNVPWAATILTFLMAKDISRATNPFPGSSPVEPPESRSPSNQAVS